MAILAFIPEIAAFLMFMLMATQLADTGPILILVEFALMGGLFLLRPMAFAETVVRWWPLLLTGFIPVLSTLWSEAPMATLRYGTQYLFTVFVGIHLARLMSPRQFVAVLLASLFTFCVLCIHHGRQGQSAEGPVLIGLTGSKNQMGFAAQLLMTAALAVLFAGIQSRALRVVALLALPLSLFLLLGVHSATALLMAVGGGAAIAALWFAMRMTPGAWPSFSRRSCCCCPRSTRW
jgi:exopolysaccharide production protein ExoQ